MNNAITVRDLTVTYSSRPALLDIDLDLPEGQLCAIVGPNGAGKSTLLKSILGLIEPVTGTIQINGQPAEKARKNLGYVPQRSAVDWDFPTDVFDVVLMGTYGRLGWFKQPGSKEKEIARHALEQVGMADRSHTQISELSGGQQQRVFLARALAQQAPVTLMDEPFAGVDSSTEEKIIAVLNQMVSEGRTVIVVHHDLETVRQIFQNVTLLSTKVVTSGPTAETMTPENLARTYGARLAIPEMA